MAQSWLICAVVVFFACACHAEFADVWTTELHESFETCLGRLPNPIDGEDLKWFLTPKFLYWKYWDQITLFRLINVLAGGRDNRPLTESRCLFESPCLSGPMEKIADGAYNLTFSACNGEKVVTTYKYAPNGLMDAVGYGLNGKPALQAVSSPALTDRKSFTLLISCLPDGSNGFQVHTTRPALSAHTRHIIKEFLDNSGFKDNFRISTSYMSSTCKNHNFSAQ